MAEPRNDQYERRQGPRRFRGYGLDEERRRRDDRERDYPEEETSDDVYLARDYGRDYLREPSSREPSYGQDLVRNYGPGPGRGYGRPYGPNYAQESGQRYGEGEVPLDRREAERRGREGEPRREFELERLNHRSFGRGRDRDWPRDQVRERDLGPDGERDYGYMGYGNGRSFGIYGYGRDDLYEDRRRADDLWERETMQFEGAQRQANDRRRSNFASYYGESVPRAGQHVGKGPQGYRKSDERIEEQVCEALSDAPDLDASLVEVKVKDSEVTLSGLVGDRPSKRRAEELAEGVTGVHDVQNQLKIMPESKTKEPEKSDQQAGEPFAR